MANLDVAVYNKYMALDQKGKIQAEYIWIGGSGSDLRTKTKTLNAKPTSVDDLPIWNFDGSSTGQAPGSDSEVYLRPVAMYPDPFRGAPNILVLCDCLTPQMEPIPTNTRYAANKIFEAVKEHKPWYGIEQEFTLFEKDGITPLGWPRGGYPAPQGPYYCGVGATSAIGRRVVESHYKACLYAGINISGTNAEVMCAQWEYQVGPCEGIVSGDQLWVSRFLLTRICEEFGVSVSFDPKPIPGDWNGAGCHTNYSTEAMRNKGGYDVIIEAIKKMGMKHEEHIAVYGTGNERRLTGAHETAHIGKFSYGVANRGASIRIPRTTEADGYGYFEDRRPASNMDPYIVTAKIAHTTCL
jgi:glutamine synthetase